MEIQIVQDTLDLAWDEFLCAHPEGRHEQSSLYGKLKAMLGWQPIRVIVREKDTIVGGTQILARRLPVWGRIGYISKGPVVTAGREDVMVALFAHLDKVARAYSIILLNIQPPVDEPFYMRPLHDFGFQQSDYYVVPPTTVLIDLAPAADDILAQMKKDGRYNVRRALREGVIIREGDEEDVQIFYELTKMTGDRKDFPYYSLEYYQEAWRLFAPRGMSKLYLAFYQDEPLAGIMAIAFGRWAIYKWGASSTSHRHLMPNYLLQWTAMMWAKELGCAYYDMGGLSRGPAEILIRDGQLPAGDNFGVARFKLKFGGQVVAFPEAYNNYYLIRPKWLIHRVANYVWEKRALRNLVRGIRLRRSDSQVVNS
jgi:peptidoglycan pentaglycine glycine transferase (the first glycine)